MQITVGTIFVFQCFKLFVSKYFSALLDEDKSSVYMGKHIARLKCIARLTAEYEASFGPLTYTGVTGDSWSWVDAEWPWHAGNGALSPARRGDR